MNDNEHSVKTDTDLEDDLRLALTWDSRIANPDAIAIRCKNGVVTLLGTVGSFRQKRLVASTARRVYGVVGVDNRLNPRPMTD